MSDAVLVGLISAGGSIIVQLLISWTKGRENDAKNAEREQHQADQLARIEEKFGEINKKFVAIDQKLEEHNGYARRFGEIEKTLAVMQKDIEYGLKERNNNVNQPK